MSPRRPDGRTEALLVRAHPGLCEGWGQCHRWAPDVYPLDDEGYIDIHMLRVPPELAVQAWEAARACPIGVISIVDIVTEPGYEEEAAADEPAHESADEADQQRAGTSR